LNLKNLFHEIVINLTPDKAATYIKTVKQNRHVNTKYK